MRWMFLTVTVLLIAAIGLVGCSTENTVVAPVDSNNIAAAPVRSPGSGSFTLEAKYTYFKNYPGGNAIYLLRIIPGPDFSGDATVKASADRLIKTEFTNTHLNSETLMTELVVDPSKQLPYGTYFITVTVSNQTQQESVELELQLMDWGVNSATRAVTARDQFIDWLAVEYPGLGSFDVEPWEKLYCHYPEVIIHEHYTFLSDNWEFRVSCHITWIPEDYYTTFWLRPRGEWEPILAVERVWDEATQGYVFLEVPLEDWNYINGY